MRIEQPREVAGPRMLLGPATVRYRRQRRLLILRSPSSAPALTTVPRGEVKIRLFMFIHSNISCFISSYLTFCALSRRHPIPHCELKDGWRQSLIICRIKYGYSYINVLINDFMLIITYDLL